MFTLFIQRNVCLFGTYIEAKPTPKPKALAALPTALSAVEARFFIKLRKGLALLPIRSTTFATPFAMWSIGLWSTRIGLMALMVFLIMSSSDSSDPELDLEHKKLTLTYDENKFYCWTIIIIIMKNDMF